MLPLHDDNGDAALRAVAMVLSGYESGFELIKGAHPESLERFCVLYVRGIPRLMLPTAPRIMNTAVMNFLGGRRFAGMVPPLMGFAARVGGPFSYLSSNVSLVSGSRQLSPLRKLMSEVLGRNDFQIALRLSFGRPNAKTVAMAISDAGEALCYAKFGSESMTNELVAHESRILEQFEGIDMPVVIPRRLFSGAWAGEHNVLITAAMQLGPLTSDARQAHQAANAVASLGEVSNSTLSESHYWRRILDDLEHADDSQNNGRYSSESISAMLSRIDSIWGSCALDFGASHGDWTRANLGTVDGCLAAFDWERYTQNSPRGIDIAHFALCENTTLAFSKKLDIEQIAQNVQQYLKAAGLDPDVAKVLIVLALLEMLLRFRSAYNVGLQSADSKFGTALQSALLKWAA